MFQQLDLPFLIHIELMYKLLPDRAKERVRREYLLRRLVVLLSAFILILLVFMVSLFPSYIFSKVRQKEVAEGTKNMIGRQEEGKGIWDDWLMNINLKLKVLAPKLDVDRPSTLMTQVIEERVSGIKINSFTWLKSEGRSELSVVGVASNRQALLAFENKLNRSEKFLAVTLPVSNLAKDRDISFELKLIPLVKS